LCDNPGEGGTTPSLGMIDVVRQQVSMDVYAMIRPRGGDFLYSGYEFEAMKRDLVQCRKAGIQGVVFGVLQADGTLDKKRCKELIDLARPLNVTCHRAFDMTRDPFEALEHCIDAGFDRILTSGQQAHAITGAPLIAELVKRAHGRIAIMAGSGINPENVSALVKQTNVNEIHFSATAFSDSEMRYRNPQVAGMGSAGGSEYKLRTVDPEVIRKIRRRV
ncbi:MAG TPA: copper homeostasis protein CutC, partial [Cyclobacteriaceae bacterium]|nr:copper homeostasis protein CutC [Cyclobacteriaceae bacterium]